MKQIDNRQKKQIQMRASSTPQRGGFFGGKRKEKTRVPEPSSKDAETSQTTAVPPAPVPSKPKAGRNEACPCGSGKKYKKCCLSKPA